MTRDMQRYLVHLVTAIGENTRSGTGLLAGLLEALRLLHVSIEGKQEPDQTALLRWAEYHAGGTVAEPIATFLADASEVGGTLLR